MPTTLTIMWRKALTPRFIPLRSFYRSRLKKRVARRLSLQGKMQKLIEITLLVVGKRNAVGEALAAI